MPIPQMFTFSSKHIEAYEKKCSKDNLKKLGLNLNHILGNYSEEHFDIIAENTNEHYQVNWIDISKNEELDDQFIYDNHKNLNTSTFISKVFGFVTSKSISEPLAITSIESGKFPNNPKILCSTVEPFIFRTVRSKTLVLDPFQLVKKYLSARNCEKATVSTVSVVSAGTVIRIF